jgi:hypothetical protein
VIAEPLPLWIGSGVKIVWDNCHTNHIRHNDMDEVTVVPEEGIIA